MRCMSGSMARCIIFGERSAMEASSRELCHEDPRQKAALCFMKTTYATAMAASETVRILCNSVPLDRFPPD